MKKYSISYYSGQALAIILIVLVVAVIIALAILSRTMSDTTRTVSEQSSAEALEVSDSVLNSISGVSLDDIELYAKSVFGETASFDSGIIFEGDDVGTLLNNFVTDPSIIFGTEECAIADTSISFEVTDPEDKFEVDQDDVFGFVFPAQDVSYSCDNLRLSGIESNGGDAGLVASRFYAVDDNDDGLIDQLKPYEEDDILGYCLFSPCPSSPWQYSWISNPSGSLDVDIQSQLFDSTDYYIREVRLRSIDAPIEFQVGFEPSGCNSGFRMIKVTASAVCNGAFRAKSVVINENDPAPAIFDYVLFNGSGLLQHQ